MQGSLFVICLAIALVVLFKYPVLKIFGIVGAVILGSILVFSIVKALLDHRAAKKNATVPKNGQ